MTVLITALLLPTPSTPTVIKNTAVQAKCSAMLYIFLLSPLCAVNPRVSVQHKAKFYLQLLHSHEIVGICSWRIDVYFLKVP